MKRPPSLQYNDKAVILSPAGNIDYYLVEDTSSVLEGWGLDVEISEHALGNRGRFSGSIAERLLDLQRAFDDPDTKLVLCSRGGYGMFHLHPELNFSGIRRHPKWVIGYSDITALHAALQYHGVASLHGPMASHFSLEGSEDVSVRYTKSILAGQPVKYLIPGAAGNRMNRTGTAKGRLFGGNLAVFCGLMGTCYARIPRDGILFIEDTGEVPYRVDRMIYQLKLAGLFDRVGGLIVGRFTDYEEDDQMYFSLHESILDAVKEYRFPVAFHFPVGHVKLNFPLVVGEMAELSVDPDHILFKQ
ncbi:MAG: LD-carboxypeptidase [Chloroflexi bacterium]|nr:LD-carboxypeptidase [Chloroflexota bacterium]